MFYSCKNAICSYPRFVLGLPYALLNGSKKQCPVLVKQVDCFYVHRGKDRGLDRIAIGGEIQLVECYNMKKGSTKVWYSFSQYIQMWQLTDVNTWSHSRPRIAFRVLSQTWDCHCVCITVKDMH